VAADVLSKKTAKALAVKKINLLHREEVEVRLHFFVFFYIISFVCFSDVRKDVGLPCNGHF